ARQLHRATWSPRLPCGCHHSRSCLLLHGRHAFAEDALELLWRDPHELADLHGFDATLAAEGVHRDWLDVEGSRKPRRGSESGSLCWTVHHGNYSVQMPRMVVNYRCRCVVYLAWWRSVRFTGVRLDCQS